MRFLLVLAMCTAMMAQSGLNVPQAGWMLDDKGALRPVMGFAGNFWLGGPAAPEATAAAFEARGGFVQQGKGVTVLDAAGKPGLRLTGTSSAAAVFGFTRWGVPALVYMPDRGELLRVAGSGTQRVPGNLEGLVAVAEIDGNDALAVVNEKDGLWLLRVTLRNGAVVSREALPGVSAPVLLEGDGTLVFERDGAMVLRAAGGAERETAVSFQAGAMTPMGDGWIAVFEKDGRRRFGLRTTPGHESVDPLPEEAR